MSDRLLLEVDAFFLEHRLCGDLDGAATDERAWLMCVACGTRIEQPNRQPFQPSRPTRDEI